MRMLLLIALLAFASPALAATFYIDNSTDVGLDSRTSAEAQSKTTPWKHLRGMKSATGNAASYIPQAGDIFVLKGGVTWHNADFPIAWNWSGTASSRITVTVDPTWYVGGSWSRPKFDADGAVMVGRVFVGWNVNTFLDLNNGNFGVNYVTFDNIELTNFYHTGNPPFGTCAQILGSVSKNTTIDHFYIHGWLHPAYTDANGARDVCHPIMGTTNPPYNTGSVFQNGIIDGSDSTGGGDSGGNYVWPSYVNSILKYMPNTLVQKGSGEIGGNLIEYCQATFDLTVVNGSAYVHPNMVETLGASSAFTIYFHDNVVHDGVPGCESGFFANLEAGLGNIYVWNNVWYNLGGNSLHLDQRALPVVAPNFYIWQNVVVPLTILGQPQRCFILGHGGGTSAIVDIRNNHCISAAASAVDPAIVATSLTKTPNLLQAPTAATAEGYTGVQSPYVFYPTSGGSTILYGDNLAAKCATLAALCGDTSYGATEGANHTVVVGARTVFSRPGSVGNVNWDAGPYAFTNASPIPNAPTGLQLLHTTSTRTTLIWAPNTETNLVGYNVYCGTATGVYEAAPVKTNTAASVAATHSSMTAYHIQKSKATPLYCIVKAYNSDGTESAASSEVSTTFTGVSRSARQ